MPFSLKSKNVFVFLKVGNYYCDSKLEKLSFSENKKEVSYTTRGVMSTSCVSDIIETQILPLLVGVHQTPRSWVNNPEMTITSSPTTVTDKST